MKKLYQKSELTFALVWIGIYSILQSLANPLNELMELRRVLYGVSCRINGDKSLKEINASTEQYKMMDINMDEIGMAWLIDKGNSIIWHNGGTQKYPQLCWV